MMMQADKPGRAVIEVILALTQIEIQNADRNGLDHLMIMLAFLEMLDHSAGRAVKNPLQIIKLPLVLHFIRMISPALLCAFKSTRLCFSSAVPLLLSLSKISRI